MGSNISRVLLAQLLLKEIDTKEAYLPFLKILEEDTEHMGHRYIASLLRGEEFGTQEEREKSKKVLEMTRRHMCKVLRFLNVDALEPLLIEAELITSNELELLHQSQHTTQDKAKKLIIILKTKGPTAHFVLVHSCLKYEDTHLSHQELYELLTDDKQPGALTQNTQVTKSYPCALELPEGITTEEYFREIRLIRKYHQIGGEKWTAAEDIYQRAIKSPENPLEVKIAITLESCTMYVINNQPDIVFARVDTARGMCAQMYDEGRNAQVLEGRCEWVLARLYRYMNEHETARKHLDQALFLTLGSEPGEERALTTYCQGCVLLTNSITSPRNQTHVKSALSIAIGCARKEDYGLPVLHGIIRLAQAYLGSPLRSPGRSQSKKNIDEAKRILRGLAPEDGEVPPRTRCMLAYTWSDLYRLDGQIGPAVKNAELALKIATKYNFKTEITSAKLRQEHLSRHFTDTQQLQELTVY